MDAMTKMFVMGLKSVCLKDAVQLEQGMKNFDVGSMRQVSIDADLSSLIYIPVEIYADDEHYLFLHKGKKVYLGCIDSKGLDKTLEYDITTTHRVMNLFIAIINEDDEQIADLIKTENDYIILMEQMIAGQRAYLEHQAEKATR